MPKGVYPRKPLNERFWEKVDRRGREDCWLWKAATVKGYGVFAPVHHKLVKAHRFAYELVKGPIPDGQDVLHKCDCPPCCNPEHLFPGTQLDNQRDSIAKGRRASQDGEHNGNAKLTETQVREVRRLRSEGYVLAAIGEIMGVHLSTISLIVCGVTWKHLSESYVSIGGKTEDE